MKTLILTLLLTPLTLIAMAQNKQFTLDDLLPGGSTYYSLRPETKYYEWWGDKLIELGTDECRLVNKKTGKTSVLFTMEQLRQKGVFGKDGNTTVQHFYNVTFPYEGKTQFLVATPSCYMLVDWSKGKVEWQVNLTSTPEEADWTDGHDWHAGSRSIAYYNKLSHVLKVVTADGKKYDIGAEDASADILYGTSVHRDEFGISKGTFWSPTGRYLAFYRMDQSMVSHYPQVNVTPHEVSQCYMPKPSLPGSAAETRCATLEPDAYPMAGEASHKVTIGILDTKDGSIRYLETGDPTDRYFTNLKWAPDEKSLYVMEVNRDQNHGSLDCYDIATCTKKSTLFEENNPKYFEPMHPIQFLPWDKTRFIYQTRRDGYNHIYVYKLQADGKAACECQLTKGAWEVISVLGFNEAEKTVLYTSNEQSAIQQNVYAVSIDGKHRLLGCQYGWHYAEASASGTYVLTNYSAATTKSAAADGTYGTEGGIPRKIDVVSVSDGKSVNLLTAADKWKQNGYAIPEVRVGTIKAADGVTDLYYRLILPVGFDPAKKYPAVVYVYGGPHAHNIDASYNYSSRGWDTYMAQQGYVMFCLDNRGSEHRGLDFEQATFRQLGTAEVADQLCGAKFLASLPYVDAERLGVHGWSFGGFMTTSLMCEPGTPFKVGVAGGPVIDWRFYEVMYGERYMDTPQTNQEGYDRASLLGKAGNLSGRLMIIYGYNDPTCVPQHTLSFIRACIDAGTYPDLFTYPGDGHNMFGTDRVHLHNVITRYFEDHLK